MGFSLCISPPWCLEGDKIPLILEGVLCTRLSGMPNNSVKGILKINWRHLFLNYSTNKDLAKTKQPCILQGFFWSSSPSKKFLVFEIAKANMILKVHSSGLPRLSSKLYEWLSSVAGSEHSSSKASSISPHSHKDRKEGPHFFKAGICFPHCWRAYRTNKMDTHACKSDPERSSSFYFFPCFPSGLGLQWIQHRYNLARMAQPLAAFGWHSCALE